MADLFQNKYRIPSSRLQIYDYSGQGMYFITICTKFMQHFFGKIINDPLTKIAKLQQTEIGEIAESEWYKSLEMRPDMNLDIGEFIVMPNHIHGIMIIGKNEINSGEMKLNENSKSLGNLELNANSESNCNSELNANADSNSPRTDAMHRVSTQSTPQYTPQSKNAFAPQSKNAFAPQSKNLASIMRGYKSAVTTYARKNNIKFEWHIRYHDHIIRNEEEFLRISHYIKNNPSKWLDDKFNTSK
jgi:REP element-mobilizing transposase RayT